MRRFFPLPALRATESTSQLRTIEALLQHATWLERRERVLQARQPTRCRFAREPCYPPVSLPAVIEDAPFPRVLNIKNPPTVQGNNVPDGAVYIGTTNWHLRPSREPVAKPVRSKKTARGRALLQRSRDAHCCICGA